MSDDVCMVYDEDGNAFDAFPFTADELEAVAHKLRKENGEITTVTIGPSPFVQWPNTGTVSRATPTKEDA